MSKEFAFYLSDSDKYETLPLSYLTTFDVIKMLIEHQEYKTGLPQHIPEKGLSIFVKFMKMLFETLTFKVLEGKKLKMSMIASEATYLIAIFDYLGYNLDILNVLRLIDLKEDGIIFMTELYKLIGKSYNSTGIFPCSYDRFLTKDKKTNDNTYIDDNYKDIIEVIACAGMCPKKVMDVKAYPKEEFKQALISTIIETCIEKEDAYNYNRIMKIALHCYPRTCFMYLDTLEDAALNQIISDIMAARPSDYLHILTIGFSELDRSGTGYVLCTSQNNLSHKVTDQPLRGLIQKYINLHKYSDYRVKNGITWCYFNDSGRRLPIKAIIDKDGVFREIGNDFYSKTEGDYVFKVGLLKEGDRILLSCVTDDQ